METRPLSTQLSQVLVAFTIELDNLFEQRMSESAPGRFRVVSIVMWSNFLRFVGDGITVGDLLDASGLPRVRALSTLGGTERWGYVFVAPEGVDEPADVKRDGYGSARGLRPEWLVRPTPTGTVAQRVVAALFGEIEGRWEQRFGAQAVLALRRALGQIVERLDVELPEYMPVVVGVSGMVSEVAERGRRRPPSDRLCVLLAQVLLAYTLAYDRASVLSLALTANVLRVLDETGADVRQLPAATGVSKEAVAMALTFLARDGWVTVESKRVRLTVKGRGVLDAAPRIHAGVEQSWAARFGAGRVAALRSAADAILTRPSGLSAGLGPLPGGWRGEAPYLAQTSAVLEDPIAHLPHHPMVLHRGGWPDGS